ncbi:hypothetical protein ANN_18881 [Periplaneta americana]|uniref:Uncharacterized protein n=1 Tax=Periplaneta americana TaxID=6978 RepID=A0ABQ8SRA6_PERAM|nr:hypothetical protein ANN_18881 [Periplaneta americana]
MWDTQRSDGSTSFKILETGTNLHGLNHDDDDDDDDDDDGGGGGGGGGGGIIVVLNAASYMKKSAKFLSYAWTPGRFALRRVVEVGRGNGSDVTRWLWFVGGGYETVVKFKGKTVFKFEGSTQRAVRLTDFENKLLASEDQHSVLCDLPTSGAGKGDLYHRRINRAHSRLTDSRGGLRRWLCLIEQAGIRAGSRSQDGEIRVIRGEKCAGWRW